MESEREESVYVKYLTDTHQEYFEKKLWKFQIWENETFRNCKLNDDFHQILIKLVLYKVLVSKKVPKF